MGPYDIAWWQYPMLALRLRWLQAKTYTIIFSNDCEETTDDRNPGFQH
jgi:hypothetical protein